MQLTLLLWLLSLIYTSENNFKEAPPLKALFVNGVSRDFSNHYNNVKGNVKLKKKLLSHMLSHLCHWISKMSPIFFVVEEIFFTQKKGYVNHIVI